MGMGSPHEVVGRPIGNDAVASGSSGGRRILAGMYFTDRGIEELVDRRGDEQVSVEWLADRLRAFVDANPQFETAVERLSSFLARDDADDE
ncbi:hypothetical protein GCM10025792_35840 [Pseudonocardia tropica]